MFLPFLVKNIIGQGYITASKLQLKIFLYTTHPFITTQFILPHNLFLDGGLCSNKFDISIIHWISRIYLIILVHNSQGKKMHIPLQPLGSILEVYMNIKKILCYQYRWCLHYPQLISPEEPLMKAITCIVLQPHHSTWGDWLDKRSVNGKDSRLCTY